MQIDRKNCSWLLKEVILDETPFDKFTEIYKFDKSIELYQKFKENKIDLSTLRYTLNYIYNHSHKILHPLILIFLDQISKKREEWFNYLHTIYMFEENLSIKLISMYLIINNLSYNNNGLKNKVLKTHPCDFSESFLLWYSYFYILVDSIRRHKIKAYEIYIMKLWDNLRKSVSYRNL